jgi:hypothetical protein
VRVQFSVNNTEWQKLQRLAYKKGYPDVSSYCRDISLQERTYAELWRSVVEAITDKPSGSVFALRDLIDAPPANLGVKLYEHQTDLGIIVNSKKDSRNINTFTKL